MDYKRIYLRVKVWDETVTSKEDGVEPGGWVEKEWHIKFFEEDAASHNIVLSYCLYDDAWTEYETTDADGNRCRLGFHKMYASGGYEIAARRGSTKRTRLED